MEERTGIVTGTGSIPSLQLQILDGHGITGSAITHASVGQPLTLDILLQNTGAFALKKFFSLFHKKLKEIKFVF